MYWRAGRWSRCTSRPQRGNCSKIAENPRLARASKDGGERFAAFKERLKKQGLKSTAQRDDIARVFFDAGHHISIEELYREVKRINPRIGYATVYRTMKLLKEAGLASESHFHDGEARYESSVGGHHHDHLICEGCGKIEEFEEPQIESLQADVAKRFGFRITGHKLELYGICRNCQKARSAPG